jgi:isoleucyl-tRNA synthetase
MRKNAGFEVVDRININYKTSDQLDRAIDAQSTYIKNETLAVQLVSNSGDASYSENWEIDGINIKIGIEKVR